MKEVLKKIASICKLIFGYGILIVLAVGGLMFFGYLAALIIGGPAAEAICTFISKQVQPIMIYATTILVLYGVVCLYLAGEKALVPSPRKKTPKKD